MNPMTNKMDDPEDRIDGGADEQAEDGPAYKIAGTACVTCGRDTGDMAKVCASCSPHIGGATAPKT